MKAVDKFVGMFAIAIWNERERRLILLRDRLGVKPLYYAWNGNNFWFGSELKALRAFEAWEPEIDRDALGEYLQYGYVAARRGEYAAALNAWEHYLEAAPTSPDAAKIGQDCAASHTGAMAGSDELADTFFKAHSLLRVDQLETLFELAPMIAGKKPRTRHRVAIMSTTGGGAATVADRLGTLGVDVVGPTQTVIDNLAKKKCSEETEKFVFIMESLSEVFIGSFG